VSVNRNLELAGGIAAAEPRDETNLLARVKVFVVGGPLASLLFAGLFTMLLVVWPTTPWSGLLFFTAAISGVLGIATIAPMNNGSFVTDGKRFLQLSSDTPLARRDALFQVVTMRDRRGAAIGSISASQMTTMLEPVDGSLMEAVARTFAYLWLIDRGAIDEARSQLARAAALSGGLPFGMAAGVAQEQAFAAAWFDRDPAAARAALAPHTKELAVVPVTEKLRYEVALALSEARHEDARTQLAKARAAMATLRAPLSGSAQWTAARLDEMEAALGAA
jgi:hypothetical protein